MLLYNFFIVIHYGCLDSLQMSGKTFLPELAVMKMHLTLIFLIVLVIFLNFDFGLLIEDKHWPEQVMFFFSIYILLTVLVSSVRSNVWDFLAAANFFFYIFALFQLILFFSLVWVLWFFISPFISMFLKPEQSLNNEGIGSWFTSSTVIKQWLNWCVRIYFSVMFIVFSVI